MTETVELLSVGRLAAKLQREPRAITSAAERAKVRPRLVLNGIAMFDAADIPQIRRHLFAKRRPA